MSTSSNHTKAYVQCCHGKHTVVSSRTSLSDHLCMIFPTDGVSLNFFAGRDFGCFHMQGDAFVVSEHKRLNIVQVHGSSVFYHTLFCSVLLYCGFRCYMIIRVLSPVTMYCKTCLLEQHNLLNV